MKPSGFYSYLSMPYQTNGNVNYGLLKEYTEEIVRSGIDGVSCVASTSEGPYLTDAERRKSVETVCRVAAGRVGVNVGVSAYSTRQVIDFANHAKDHGATCLMMEVQQYFPISAENIYRHYEEVSAAVDLDIRLYNLPAPSRLDWSPEQIHTMSPIKGIRSVKDASGDVKRLKQIRDLSGHRFILFCGLHFQILEGMRLGAEGWDVTLHPLIAADVIRLYRKLEQDPWSKEAEQLFARWEPVFLFFRQHGVPQSIKAISQKTSMPFGVPRRPIVDMDDKKKSEIWELVQKAIV